jgi:four helix bundle protein
VRDFKTLIVWQKAHQLTLAVYTATGQFPREEIYGLTSQIRRSAASIPANIAEGRGRNGDSEMALFLQIAMGSASELEYHLWLARDLGYITGDVHANLDTALVEVKRMLNSFISTVRHGAKS